MLNATGHRYESALKIVGPVLATLVLLVLACAAQAAAETGRGGEATLRLAANGTATFDIVVPDDTDTAVPPAPQKPLPIEFGNARTSLWETAHLLADVLQTSTGAAFTVRKESDTPDQAAALHVGPTRLATQRLTDDPRAADLDHDGFVHLIDDDQHVFILGGSDLGTEFGVYDFLERHLGVRWLYPGDIGTHIPTHDTLEVPVGFFRDEPAFLSRYFRPHRVEGAIQWARHNRAHLRVEFHHNIPKLFPHKLTQQHPELYPIIDGQRYLPPTINIPTWHPCYTHENSVPVTVGLINDFFAAYPIYDSIALGISDANEDRNCHCPTCLAEYPGHDNSLGFAERSDVYYDWCNKVIAGVHESYPDKKFGCLAYRGVTDPPSDFRIDDALIPFLCFDRMLWADPDRGEQDRKLTAAWADKAAELGWYDYLYGETYVVPRIYSGLLRETLRFAYGHNVRHYYAEANPAQDWHEGPKYYIALRLLWNPEADVEALRRDWCEAAVGKDAAADLVNYFAFMEDFWTNRVPETPWFSDRSKIYLIFNTYGYLDALTQEDVEQCSRWLAAVEEKAGDGKQKQRARQLRESFESRRRDTIDYFMVNNAIPADPAQHRDAEQVEVLDFNEKPRGWEPASSENRGTWHWEPAAGRDGSGALRLDDGTSIIRRQTPVKPTGKYRIDGWYKAEGALPDAARLEMRLQWRDKNRDEFRTQRLAKLLPVDDASDWQPFSFVGTPPRERGRAGHEAEIVFSFHYAPESSVLIDDVTVTRIVVRP